MGFSVKNRGSYSNFFLLSRMLMKISRSFSNRRNSKFLKPLYFTPLFLFFSVLFFFTGSGQSYAADQENCMFCHSYPLLGTVDDNGTYNSFFIDEDHYESSVHQNVLCSECHKGITKVPHEKNNRVTCTSDCHMADPTIGRKFSHKKVKEVLLTSAHMPGYKYLRDNGTAEDFPKCISCHTNVENKVVLASRRNLEKVVQAESRGKCYDCHSNLNDFVERNMVHVLRRTEHSYTQTDIMNMCVSCHNNQDLNQRHKMINAIYSYLENYHGKSMKLGMTNAPSCIDCHILPGDSPHAIKSVNDPDSATNIANRVKTCTRSDCHVNGSAGMGKSIIHVTPTDFSRFPVQFVILVCFTCLTILSFVSLMIILILELIRMMFPHCTIIKERSDKK